jgi:chorismate mutase
MTLENLRKEIGEVDREIIRLIARRQQISAKIARIKHLAGIPIHDKVQVDDVLGRAFDLATEQKIDPVAVQHIFEILIAMSEERQRECQGDGNLP